MNSMINDINSAFTNARTEYNQIYKDFLFISDYFENKYQDDYMDLFTASTFSKVVPDLISEDDYLKILKKDKYYQRYPSPEGDVTLIHTFHKLIKKIYGLDFTNYETMVCQGTMQAIDAISCILKGKIVFVMDSTVTFAKSIPTANGAEVVLIKTINGIIDLNDLESKIKQYDCKDRMYLYLNYPNNPTGAQINHSELDKIIDITQKYNLRIVHDHDICFTSYDENRPSISIFSNKKAVENSIEIYTLSKEFGLSGLRIGIIVGNKEFIEMIKSHNYEMNVMIPTLNQRIATLAMQRVNPKDVKNRIKHSMKTLVDGFRALGWNDLKYPQAGISFLLPVPASFKKEYGEKAGELFAFYLQKNYGIGVGPARCNCSERADCIRVLSMEPEERCRNMFKKIAGLVRPGMPVPEELYDEYSCMIELAGHYSVR